MFFFFFNATATTEIYTLSLHDALPICTMNLANYRQVNRSRIVTAASHTIPRVVHARPENSYWHFGSLVTLLVPGEQDRKSTRLNSSHGYISYAVFCLKKKKKTNTNYSH